VCPVVHQYRHLDLGPVTAEHLGNPAQYTGLRGLAALKGIHSWVWEELAVELWRVWIFATRYALEPALDSPPIICLYIDRSAKHAFYLITAVL